MVEEQVLLNAVDALTCHIFLRCQELTQLWDIVLCERYRCRRVAQGWVCCPAGRGTGLGLLSRCACDRAGSVIPLSGQGWVCYPAAKSRAGSVIPLLLCVSRGGRPLAAEIWR